MLIMNHQLAFLGLGVMGAPMAKNLANAPCQIKVWNRTKNRPHIQPLLQESSLTMVDTIAEAVESAEIIFTCLGDVPDVEEVLLSESGVINFAPPNSLVVDFSTIGSTAVKNIASQLEKKQIRFLDAPISGGDIGAQQGTLTIMVGGKEKDFRECLPYLEIMGKNITHCGDVGSGQGVKLCNQVLASLHMVALCEAMKLAQVQNIDPNLIVKVCSTGAAGSWALSNLGKKIIEEDFEPGFMIKHILKDLRLIQETLQDRHLPGVELANQLFQVSAELNEGEGYNQGAQGMINAYQNLENFN
ncbi:MAG: NAD(P)-dependent oxidoreductase [Geminocystis sp.]